MKKYKAAFFGLAHPHAETLYNALKNREDVDCIGYADVSPHDEQPDADREANLTCHGCTMERYENWLDLLDKNPDIAIVAADNKNKVDICLKTLSMGILTIIEKPMAINYEDAKRMVDCAKKHNTTLVTNWPIAWFPAFREAKKLADAGEVGEIRRVVYRSPATWGPYSYLPGGVLPPEETLKKTWWYQHDLGGGSILDYACYGAMITTWVFGKRAERVCAIKKSFDTKFSDVEDYSAMLLDFGSGVGLLEGSWSSYNPAEIATGPVIYGSDGVIVCDRHSKEIKIYKSRTHPPKEPDKVISLDSLIVAKSMGDNIIDFMNGDGELDEMLSMELNLDAMAALDAGRRAAENGNVAETEK